MSKLGKWAITLFFVMMLVGSCPATAWAESADEGVNDAQLVGEGDIVVGDGVTATFDKDTGTVTFFSDGGTLTSDWKYSLGIENDKIKSIKVSATSGKIYLPENSESLFLNCNNLMNLDLSHFDTSRVTNMGYMFGNCSNLKDLDLSHFDTSNVTNMTQMFMDCRSLENLNLDSFNTSNVTNMRWMFYYCSRLTTLDLSGFDTSNVMDMSAMFVDCHRLANIKLSSFNTSAVTTMESMFYKCEHLTTLDLSGFDTENVTNMAYMFSGCRRLINLDLSNFDTANVTGMDCMFEGCNNLTNLDLSSFDTLNVTEMNSMFRNCNSLTNLDLSSFDTSNVIYMYNMFRGCSSLTTLDLSCFETASVTSMSYMFEGCKSLTALDLSNFDTSSVTDMAWMFVNCWHLTNLDLGNFVTSNVMNMTLMFGNCSSLTTLDLSSFDTSNVDYINDFFSGCGNLELIRSPKRNSVSAKLPHTMYDKEGNTYSTLPILSESIVLANSQQMAGETCNPVTGIMVDKDTITVNKGISVKLTATVLPAMAFNKNVIWVSSDENVAMVDAKGNITTLKIGTADITATTVDGGFSAVCKLTVEAPNVSGITLDKENASLVEGDTLQLTATIAPEDAGNKAVIWMSNDENVAMVDKNGLVTAVSEGSADITVTTDDGGFMVVCKVKIAKKIEFKDVADENLWYYDSVYWAVRNNVTSGMGEGTFQPMAKLSRAQAVTFLYKLAGQPDVSGLQTKEFSDVAKSAWYYNAVKWAVSNEITSGYGEGTFQPNVTCNRAMIVTFLMRYSKLAGTYTAPTTSASFKDVSANAWYKEAVDWAVSSGVTSGYGEGTFQPMVTCNRAMMVTFLRRVAEMPRV